MLVLEALQVIGVSLLSLVDLTGILEELIHSGLVLARLGVGIARNLLSKMNKYLVNEM